MGSLGDKTTRYIRFQSVHFLGSMENLPDNIISIRLGEPQSILVWILSILEIHTGISENIRKPYRNGQNLYFSGKIQGIMIQLSRIIYREFSSFWLFSLYKCKIAWQYYIHSKDPSKGFRMDIILSGIFVVEGQI